VNSLRVLCGAVLFVASGMAAFAAEDHSAHQPAAESPPATEDHAHYTGHDVEAARSTPPDEHAGHAMHDQDQPTESELNHIPPDPPQHAMRDLSNEEMIELMQMDDMGRNGMLLVDQLEWREIEDRDGLVWDAQAWYGNDYTKLRLKSEGEHVAGEYDGRAEIYLDRVLARFWNVHVGVRQDFSEAPSRTWAGIGVQGLAPYWFEIEATAYVGEEGRLAANFSAEYEMLLTQRLVLQPKLEFELYNEDDPQNGIGSGLADTELGVRLRYEIRRELAPYLGVVWTRAYGDTADMAREEGRDEDDVQFVAGMRFWF
jgi:copper resistance protein B